MSGEYRGETDAKRVARLILADSIRQQLGGVAIRGSKAICLAGDGGDARMLRAMGMPVGDIVCVDRDEDALSKVSKLVPGADFRLGDIRPVIGSLEDDSVCCALLDFCGHITRGVRSAVRLMSRKLQIPGLLSVTYLRGRETLNTPGIREGKAFWERGERGDLLRPNERMQAYRETFGMQIAAIITKHRNAAETIYVQGPVFRDTVAVRVHRYGQGPSTPLHPSKCHGVDGSWWLDERDLILYHSGHSPMCIVTLALSRKRPPSRWNAVIVRTEAVEREPRLWALRNADMEAHRVADYLNLPVGTISAWRAHETRGTYAEFIGGHA